MVYIFDIFSFADFCDITRDYMVGHGYVGAIGPYIAML